MHKTPPEDIARILTKVAELRVQGKSWESIAEKVNRASSTIRRWLERYPEFWMQTFLQHEESAFTVAANVALVFLRNLAQNSIKDPKLHAQVNMFLCDRRLKLLMMHLKFQAAANKGAAKPVDARWTDLIARLEKMSHEELKEEILEFAAQYAAGDAFPLPRGEESTSSD